MEKFVELIDRGTEILEVAEGDNKGNKYRLNIFCNLGWLPGANMWIKGAQSAPLSCFEKTSGFTAPVGTIYNGSVDVIECEPFDFRGRTCTRIRMVNIDNSLSAANIQQRLDNLGVTAKQRENVAVFVNDPDGDEDKGELVGTRELEDVVIKTKK